MYKTILIVEDDPKISSGLRDNLEFEGYQAAEAWNAGLGAEKWAESDPDLVILDLMLPGRDGFSLLRQMRARRYDTPVIILSARGEEWDKLKGFRLGCDDYMVKPFSIMELLARIKVILRRNSDPVERTDKITLEGMELDLVERKLRIADEEQVLSGLEFELAALFMSELNRVLPRKELIERVWKASPDVSTRSVDVYVGNLRRKLEDSGYLIETVYKVGYRLKKK